MSSVVDYPAPKNNFKAPPSSSSSLTTSPNFGTALSPSSVSVTASNVSRRQRIRLATLRSEAGNKKSSGSPTDSKVKISEQHVDEEDLVTMPSLASFSVMDHDEDEWSYDDEEEEEESIDSEAQDETLTGDEKKEDETVANQYPPVSSTLCTSELEDTITGKNGAQNDKSHPIYIPKPGGKSEFRRYVDKSAFALESSTESERVDNGDSQQQHGQRRAEDANHQDQLPMRREHVRMVARRSTPLFLPHEEILQGVLQAKRDKNVGDTNLRQPVRRPESEIEQDEQTVAEENRPTEETTTVKDAIEEFPAAPVETNSEGEEPEQELTVEPLPEKMIAVIESFEEFPAAPVETKSEGEEPEQELTVEPQLEQCAEQEEQATEKVALVSDTAFLNLELPRTTTEMLVYGEPLLDPAKPKYRSLTRHSAAFRPTQKSQIIDKDETVRRQIHQVQPCRLSNDEQMEYASAGMPIKQQRQPKVLNVTTTTYQVQLPMNEYTPRPVGAADFSQA